MIDLKTGALTQGEIEAMLNALPGDLTFVGPDDTIRYFNEPRMRLFSRSQAILGTSVQSCHPEKSVQLVNKIISELKAGKAEAAQSWANIDGRLASIRYFAVRDEAGSYLGCLELAQDVSGVREHLRNNPGHE
jgi:DUF438 domain-containing protein